MKDILIIRSLPLDRFNRLSFKLRSVIEGSFSAVVQGDITDSVDGELFDFVYTVSPGRIDRRKVRPLRRKIGKKYKGLVIPIGDMPYESALNIFDAVLCFGIENIFILRNFGRYAEATPALLKEVLAGKKELKFDRVLPALAEKDYHLWLKDYSEEELADGAEAEYCGYIRNVFGKSWRTFSKVTHIADEAGKGKTFKIGGGASCLLPVALFGKRRDTGNLKFYSKRGSVSVENLKCAKWHYFRLSPKDKIEKIKSGTHKIFVGEPMALSREMSKKIVLLVTLDAFSRAGLSRRELFSLMPNTAEFFKNGRFFPDNKVQADWTLPAVASMMTGRYPSGHGLYQPSLNVRLPGNSPLLSELFKMNGYITFASQNVSRAVNPLYGFARGFDRFVAFNYKGGPGEEEKDDTGIIEDAVEQVKAFDGRSQFLYINLLKIHNLSNMSIDFSYEASIPLRYRKALFKGGRLSNFDEAFYRYKTALSNADDKLKRLYDVVEKYYGEDEVVFVLTGDHGNHWLPGSEIEKRDYLMSVPLFVKGSKVEPGTDNGLVQGIDIFAGILKMAGIECCADGDSLLWPALGGDVKRECYISESIYKRNLSVFVGYGNYILRYNNTVSKKYKDLKTGVCEFYAKDRSGYKKVVPKKRVKSAMLGFLSEHINNMPERLVKEV